MGLAQEEDEDDGAEDEKAEKTTSTKRQQRGLKAPSSTVANLDEAEGNGGSVDPLELAVALQFEVQEDSAETAGAVGSKSKEGSKAGSKRAERGLKAPSNTQANLAHCVDADLDDDDIP